METAANFVRYIAIAAHGVNDKSCIKLFDSICYRNKKVVYAPSG
jgi:hypothetical protein